MPRLAPPGRAIAYLLWMAVFALSVNLVLVRQHAGRVHTIDAREKQAAYLRAPQEWNLVFLGDSRTYTDVDPDRLDPLLGSHSVNLAFFAHWFPTQYASFHELIPHIPPRTVVVWSVGEENFRPVQAVVNSTYPIRPWLLPRYVRWGFALTDLQDNVAGGVLDVLPAHALRDPFRKFVDSRWSTMTSALSATSPPARADEARSDDLVEPVAPVLGVPVGLAEAERRRAEYESDPRVLRVKLWFDEGRVTSIEAITRRGFYEREELDSPYFRRRQAVMAARTAAVASDYTASPRYWNVFVGILDEFRTHHVRLVVNRVEEAPYQYAVGENRAHTEAFMDHVQREVEAHGFPFVSVDWQRFENADYFDYNHLNRRGVERFTPMFATVLRPYIR